LGSSFECSEASLISQNIVDLQVLSENSHSVDSLISVSNRPKQAQERNRGKKNQNLGQLPKKHDTIRVAAKAVHSDPINPKYLETLVAAISAALESDYKNSKSKRGGTSKLRTAALLRTYAPQLDDAIANVVRDRCAEHFGAIDARVEKRFRSEFVLEREAALLLGLTVSDLLMMLRSPQTRYALGWPRPIGGRVTFARAVLKPETAADFLGSTPSEEPWPRSSWPEGWR
jgi:hypothetical protein